MNTSPTNQLQYAGFWRRLGALLLDTVIMLPLAALAFWISERYRLFYLYYFVPSTLFGLFYSVYLVRRFGGTPGKLIMGVRICKVTGEPVGYREALLRYLPDFVLGVLMSIAMLISVFHMSDTEYHSLAFMDRAKRMVELGPPWQKPLQIIQNIWIWGELIVLLTNRKRRALHDFIAGTIVVRRDAPEEVAQPSAPPNADSAGASPAAAS
jgi:uncharacterized RDD family membrane protein YckC